MRIVVVGAGMVGHRFAEEAVRLDPAADVVVVGEEPYEPYNRVLLSDVVAGRTDLSGVALPEVAGVRSVRGVRAVSVDVARRRLHLDDGTPLDWDHLVLATGARPRVLSLPGLHAGDGRLVGGAHALRTIDDARGVVAGAVNATHACVVGAGAIGVEVACGLRRRGLEVTLLASRDGVLDRDLDPRVSAVATRALADLGVHVVARAGVRGVDVSQGHVDAVVLEDGTRVPTGLLVLATGSVPRTELAVEAGLTVRSGIVVDARLRTSDAAVSAIGDCAETPDGVSGLVAPGWAQATALAEHLLRDRPVPPVPVQGAALRLKAVGLDVVTAGVRASTAGPDDRVVSIDDAGARRYVEVVVRQGTLVGSTCVGAPDLAARLAMLLDRPGVVPPDPLQLLVGVPDPQVGSPTSMPSSTTVCRCNGVTKAAVVHAWDAGCRTMEDVAATTRATTGCGGCRSLVCGLVEWLQEVDPPSSHDPVAGRERGVAAR
jgi:assimilatory nitrate reductase electron transfer subunit